MSTTVHFFDVGAGNMVLIQTDNGKNILYDCNVTEEDAFRILSYLCNAVGYECEIDVFICSHRDADHIRGIGLIDNNFIIREVWDNGHSTLNTDSDENKIYMRVREEVGHKELKAGDCFNFGNTKLEVLFAGDKTLPNDPNTQSTVLRVRHTDSDFGINRSVLLTGDSDITSWRESIMLRYRSKILQSDFLLASHHGSYSFFGSTDDKTKPYTSHIEAISPILTVISADGRTHNHPDSIAESLYTNFSTGSLKGEKVVRTDIDGTMKLDIGYFIDENDPSYDSQEDGFEGETLHPKPSNLSNTELDFTDWKLLRSKSRS